MAFVENLTIWGEHLLQHYGLLGLFAISVVTSASVMVFTPGLMFTIIAGTLYPPIIVALVAGLGNTLGEFTSYFIGLGGNYIIEKKVDKKKLTTLEKVEGWFKRHGFILFPIFAVGPLPMDLLGIVAGGLRYSKWKFFVGVFIGKFIKCLVLAYLGYAGISILGW
jgi:membrane protein YqaA with SNARE-associated domain